MKFGLGGFTDSSDLAVGKSLKIAIKINSAKPVYLPAQDIPGHVVLCIMNKIGHFRQVSRQMNEFNSIYSFLSVIMQSGLSFMRILKGLILMSYL